MVMAPEQMNRQGFTLVEVLVGLAVAGILTAIIATVMSQGIVSSRALLEHQELAGQKTALRTILHRDLKGINLQSTVIPDSEGFHVQTGHNLLISSSLPVEVSWAFSGDEIVRTEKNIELDYFRKQVLSTELTFSSINLLCPVQERWIGLDSWLMGQDRPPPGALRVRLGLSGATPFEIVEHLPVHE